MAKLPSWVGTGRGSKISEISSLSDAFDLVGVFCLCIEFAAPGMVFSLVDNPKLIALETILFPCKSFGSAAIHWLPTSSATVVTPTAFSDREGANIESEAEVLTPDTGVGVVEVESWSGFDWDFTCSASSEPKDGVEVATIVGSGALAPTLFTSTTEKLSGVAEDLEA